MNLNGDFLDPASALDPSYQVVQHRPVVVGEIGTFFPENRYEFAGQHVLNVVWHLRALGFDPILISRIGDDNEGHRTLSVLESASIDTSAVQIDATLSTVAAGSSRTGAGERFECAWQALETASTTSVFDSASPPILYHGIAATKCQQVQNVLNTIHNRIGTPFVVDVDLDPGPHAMCTLRRALLGVRWLRIRAEHLPALVGERDRPESPSVAADAISIQRRFALEGVAIDHNGLTVVTASGENAIRSTESPPGDSSYLPGARDASAAVLIIGILLGWSPRLTMERSAQFAYLVGSTAVAHQIDPVVHSRLLRFWGNGDTKRMRS